ncbi:MAG: PsbP-related protein [Parcubacteria group bacterium]|jgi:hypothetical protein
MNKKIATEFAFGIIIIIAIIVGGAVWLSGNQKAEAPTSNVKTTQPAPQPAATDETADWQTYRNEKYGFEFQYPRGWNVKEIQDGVIALSKDNLPKNTININITNNTEGKSLGEITQERIANLQIQKNSTDVFLGGLPAKRVKDNGIVTYNGVYSINKEHIYYLYISEESQLNATFNQILSTFKFTE